MVYGIFSGCYSDWDIVGYFNNRVNADKYCVAYYDTDCYVREIKDLENKEDLSKISLKYTHEIVFDFNKETGDWVLRNEPDRYECYIAENIKPNIIEYIGYQWVSFFVNIAEDNRKLAEKIAQDYLAELLSYGDSKKVYEKNVALMNSQFNEPFKIAEQLKKQEKIRQQELAELERLKSKYEHL